MLMGQLTTPKTTLTILPPNFNTQSIRLVNKLKFSRYACISNLYVFLIPTIYLPGWFTFLDNVHDKVMHVVITNGHQNLFSKSR
ncbi:hypothetical protein KC19_VG147100 [Ceratodon purpureus]|uniref:Transmembrane protein n=1 Tax=Ceratodon purpureus TaxID=3225 RepID=A0A8T0HQK3_CERPU|nr:hypothetical protein KC19_VG147100 [Ceratodon purpureus]